jgi:hypothetical protein
MHLVKGITANPARTKYDDNGNLVTVCEQGVLDCWQFNNCSCTYSADGSELPYFDNPDSCTNQGLVAIDVGQHDCKYPNEHAPVYTIGDCYVCCENTTDNFSWGPAQNSSNGYVGTYSRQFEFNTLVTIEDTTQGANNASESTSCDDDIYISISDPYYEGLLYNNLWNRYRAGQSVTLPANAGAVLTLQGYNSYGNTVGSFYLTFQCDGRKVQTPSYAK